MIDLFDLIIWASVIIILLIRFWPWISKGIEAVKKRREERKFQ
jgi:hypothetical protein